MTNESNCKRIALVLPTHIGGPGTRLPLFLESILAWTFAIGCLGVALWHYQVDRYWTRIYSICRPHHRPYRHRHRLPLTTHSRREWLTVSDYQGLRSRYHQLIELIYTAILVAQNKQPNENSLNNNEYVIVDGKICQANQTRDHEDQPSSMGKAVSEWLCTGLVVSTTPQISKSTRPTKRSKPDDNKRYVDDESDSLICRDSCETLIGLIRTNEAPRRLISLLLGEDPIYGAAPSTNSTSNLTITKNKNREDKEKCLDRLSSEEPGANAVLQALRKIWPRLMELPASLPPPHESDNAENIAISVIVPAFREDGGRLAAKLQASLEHAIEPHRIEIIVIHVVDKDLNRKVKDNNGEKTYDNNSSFTKTLREGFLPTMAVECSRRSAAKMPVLRIVEYYGGGGRGPCLNYGTKYARGGILTFLHGDTRLATYGWDKAISKALEEDGSGGPRMTCCAFSFAIDTSPEALMVRTKKMSDWDCKKSNHNRPPGLRAIEVTANLRCKLFSLPYGDQCLSLPTYVFRHIGGFPDQCLMEDYELIRLLRMRSAASLARPNSRSLDPNSSQGQETIKFLSDYKAICSPRRWQTYGVLYVTYTNSYCVKRYNNGELTPDELYCEYYRTRTPPDRMNGERSPWETGL